MFIFLTLFLGTLLDGGGGGGWRGGVVACDIEGCGGPLCQGWRGLWLSV